MKINNKNIKIKDILEKDVPIGEKDLNLKDAIKLMINKHTNIFIALNEKKEIQGLFTLYDILDKILPFFLKVDSIISYISVNEIISKEKIKQLSCLKVRDIMIKKVYSLKEEDDFIKAISLMYVKNFDYIPIVNKKNKYVGVVNRLKVEKTIVELIENNFK
ncbi:MAG: hypothetical protein KatS3mg092_0572 [Patescibacteria group bacterium]|nr:MAG: hypothetical protein KatS3mg092_0572 [Patescibacteria group bacterium]